MLGQTPGEQPLLAAGELYSGQHWQRAVAAAESTGAELWVLSAGLGLLHITDRVVPYEATFSSMQASPRNIWSLLTSSSPTGRRCASLQALMQERPHDRFIVAASPVYLQAVEEDLCAGRDELASPEQMTIVTSKGYQGCLGNNVTLSSAAMMKELNTNMTGLNISHAVKILKMQDERVTRNAA
ncbi:TPA: tgtA5 cluster protein 2 [Enterobacter roggenkampii]|nr:tgtA5 cluster protein 2 [Enterobacter roggenkampii]